MTVCFVAVGSWALMVPGRLRQSQLLIVTVLALGVFAPVTQAQAAERELEPVCVAAGTAMPSWFWTVVYNRHPQSKTESLIEVDAAGMAHRLPKACEGDYRREGYLKVEVRSSGFGKRWLPIRSAWEPLGLDYSGSPLSDKSTHYSFGAALYRGYLKRKKDLGCVRQARVSLRLELQDARSGRIVAARFARVGAEVDTWRTSRCLGQLSIRDGTRRCRHSALGIAVSTPHRWTIGARAVSCDRAKQVAQAALRGQFGQASLESRRVLGWRCVYSHNSAAACMSGAARVYLRTNRKLGSHCEDGERYDELIAAQAPCSVATELAQRAVERSGSAPGRYRLGGASWVCFRFRVSPVIAHHCYARNALISFESPDPRLAEPPPSEIAPGVVYPGNGLPALGRKPILHFGLDWAVDNGQVVLEVIAEEGLSGRPAQLQVELWRYRCARRSTSSCEEDGRVGAPVLSEVTLAQRFDLAIGPLKRRGHWSYKITLSTDGFTADNVRYQSATARLTFLMGG